MIQLWQNCRWTVALVNSLIASVSMIVLPPRGALAQIEPDATLPVNSIVPPNCNVCTIDGGTVRGGNLFHSFRQFSIPTNGEAFFNNSIDIQNIITRVNGPTSIIDGTLRANGSANLFLMNPQGITFGPNARLDIGGSFVATTANEINFADGSRFSTLPSASSPLLSVNVPVGLQLGPNAQNIQVQRASLQVQPGKTLALIGNGVFLPGGTLLAPGGRVELAGVKEGTVDLDLKGSAPKLTAIPPTRADVVLTEGALVDVRSGGGGDIFVYAQNVRLDGTSALKAGIAPGQGSSTSQAGEIQVDAIGEVRLAGATTLDQRTEIANSVGERVGGVNLPAIGQAGTIRIKADVLRVTDGAQIVASLIGDGKAGTIIMQANKIYFSGGKFVTDGFASTRADSRVEVGSTATGEGAITIKDAQLLSITGGAFLTTSTDSNRRGDAGTIIVHAPNGVVQLDGVGPDGIPSSINSQVLRGAIGNGGEITLTVRTLEIHNGASINTRTRGQGKAGNITVLQADTVLLDGTGPGGSPSQIIADTQSARDAGIVTITNTRQLIVQNGAKLSARTSNGGFGGILDINATESVTADGLNSELRFDSVGSGDARGITIKTPALFVRNGARITVNGERTGSPGDLVIDADFIEMDNAGQLTGTTRTRTGGNIRVNLRSYLLMKDGKFGGSKIRTSAEESGEGGTVTILTPVDSNNRPTGFVISNGIRKNNDVLATAIRGRGGVARARANVFGFIESQDPTPNSDFTANSLEGENGPTIIEGVDREPEEPLPVNLVDPQIAQGCRALRAPAEQSKFIVTGRGGLSSNPDTVLNGDAVQVDLVTRQTTDVDRERGDREQRVNNSPSPISNFQSPNSQHPTPNNSIVEAQRWVKQKNGEIALIAEVPTGLRSNPQPTPDCTHFEERRMTNNE